MSKVSYYTQEGLDKLHGDLNTLKTTQRKEIARQLEEARSKGDLSENAEYDAAKDAQAKLEMEIAKLEEILINARLIDKSSIDTSQVSILNRVRIKNQKNQKEFEYTIVAEEEANLAKGKISITSPIGKGLLGKKKGDLTDIKTPAGKIVFEILEIMI